MIDMKNNRRLIYLLLLCTFCAAASAQQKKTRDVDASNYPYWGTYEFIDVAGLDTITAQKWVEKDHVITGWDWSLPESVEPSPKALVGLQRNFNLKQKFQPLDLKFKSNAVGVLWVSWRDLEPTQGNYQLQPLIDRIKQANEVGLEVVLRLLGHSKLRGYDDKAIERGQAPLWLEDLGVPFLPMREGHPNDNLNYDPSHPIFHKHYLMLIEELAKAGIPEMVKAAYIGYASPSNGDEGIGPHGEKEAVANDKEPHVRERLDAWGKAFEGIEYKLYMGGSSDYGFQKGFGVRRGFVEMYMYHIPDSELGQHVDESGYLYVDEEAPIIKYNTFNGEENEEYEDKWATKSRGFRFGMTTVSYPYRFFTSTLRTLQMRCNYLLMNGPILPKMLPFLSQEMGRTVEDTPDVWSALRTSYVRAGFYKNHDDRGREITAEEKAEGIAVKNFERWLYQRDMPGYETTPAVKIEHPIEMWMIQEGKYYDYITRSGKKIGFNMDDRFQERIAEMAIKVTYFDHHKGTLLLKYDKGKKEKSISLTGDGGLKTATFIVPKMKLNSMEHGFDFTLEAGANTETVVVSMVRVISTKE